MFNYNNSLYVMVLLITLNFKVQIFSETNINNDIFTDFFVSLTFSVFTYESCIYFQISHFVSIQFFGQHIFYLLIIIFKVSESESLCILQIYIPVVLNILNFYGKDRKHTFLIRISNLMY